MEIKHIHADCNFFNGRLYFLVENRIMYVEVGTPNFNDYGEWRISGISYSKHQYNPGDNEVELIPYENIKPISINETDFEFLNYISKMGFNEEGLSDEESKVFVEKFGEYNDELAGGMIEGEETFTIFKEDPRTEVKYDEWLKVSDDEKTSFEKIIYPILVGFKEGYLKTLKDKKCI